MTPRTFLTVGQRFTHPDASPWRLDGQVTIMRVDADAEGEPRVVSRFPDGMELDVPAAQVKAIVAAGLLVPVAGPVRIICC